MMNYEMFVEELKNKMSVATDVPVENIEFAKEGDKYATAGDRLLVKFAEHDDAWEVCGLHVKELFEEYQNGTSLETIVEECSYDIEQIKEQKPYENTRKMWNYGTAKDQLFIRLLNYDRNKEELKDAVYKRVGDIALVLYMKISEYERNVTSTKIHKIVVEKWQENGCHLSEDDIFNEALANTYTMNPPRIYKWEQMIFNPSYDGEDFMTSTEDVISAGFTGNCISTTKKTNGAVAIFLPGVAEKLADSLDSDLYLVFTSIHEVMVHKAEGVDPEDLKIVLKDTLEEATPKEDFLTSRIYMYEKDTHKFVCIG